jgi:hypothetical protein
MSVEYEFDIYLKSPDIETAKSLLQDKAQGDVRVRILDEHDDGVFLDITGYRCDEYWDKVFPELMKLELENLVYMLFCDMGFSYEVKGHIREMKVDVYFSAEDNMPLIEKLRDSKLPLKTVMQELDLS